MGVPALFRWLSKKYPKIIEKVIEESPANINGVEIPVDISKPNPNGMEFDNLYLDMNGIIHPCCNPENKKAPETEDDMMIEIFKYIERIVAMVRPRKILYLAIDGVAPRAKMNQQRSRRFRKARDDNNKLEEKSKEIEKLEESGVTVDTELQKKGFDTNCITPGTPFMANLAKCLRYWIADKLNSDPGWKNLKVILSDASVPGEGEHKYLEVELKVSSVNWPFNLENAIDDWIFLCFFVGNDFLPHLPSLEIREGAIDTLISIWKRCLPLMGGYMTNSGDVDLKRVQYLVTELGKMEDEIFIRRHNNDQKRSTQPAYKRRKINDAKDVNASNASELPHLPVGMQLLPVKGVDSEVRSRSNEEVVSNRQTLRMANLSAARKLRAELNGSNYDSASTGVSTVSQKQITVLKDSHTEKEQELSQSSSSSLAGKKRKSEDQVDSAQSSSGVEDEEETEESSDFINIGDIQICFDLGEPFKPFEQLMGVLPAESKDHLPEPFWRLMTHEDSEIIDFYPSNFRIDLNGKKYDWQGVALLPFIEEFRLLKAVNTVYPFLSSEEDFRNTLGSDVLCLSNKHRLYDELCALYSKRKNDEPIPLNPTISDKLIGFVARDPNCIPESTFYSPLPERNLPDIVNDRSLSVLFSLPKKANGSMHKSVLLKNAKLDPPVLGREDHDLIRNGRGRGRGRGYNNSPSRGHSYHNVRDLPGYQYTSAYERENRYGSYDNRDYYGYQYNSGSSYENRDDSRYHSNNYYENSSRYHHHARGAYPYNVSARGNTRGFGRGTINNYYARNGYSQNNYGDRYESQDSYKRDNER
ncbi:10050_t:CDS:10 [Acaulospora colombiana]|uniref:10050_t:CDS:1 n=1 Tax=Acaulospora colombiana TaxID=27376 RepID=A0ACA9LTE6_9GLOM|nr:10050_t:CDS:10 [Acaulospora colombiana]